MAISKKLAAIFAGLLLAGSFGLAGCSSYEEFDGKKYPANPTECSQEDYSCFPGTNIRYPAKDGHVTREKYEEYKPLFDAYCDGILCKTQWNDEHIVITVVD